ncbi:MULTISPECIES: 2-hydroxychromene-2-carboxylate isomerase [Massilia]|uniref:2-hydroxychromene-2-carboxylate isomerase n=2 Tax=Massilia TaxID=149698 RepID=A0ABY4AAG6_9BURK|nr:MULTISPECIES: 2-hydroxychromene-2-carboxylate isomerase [Massilia]NHZ41841.1 2-hydroxychromene-2-carboxylate isomerase [Massilia aquatica]UOD31711.1 2-hydroxychromene-2-carboxylate isomerase [Massilia violaceinigra]
MSKTVQYFFAPQSPWAYLGHERFVAMANARGALIDIKPFDLGKVFSVSGGLPLAKRAPQRQAYRLQELARWSAHLGLPLIAHPTFFPVPPEAAARLIIAARTSLGAEAALGLTGAIMRALWAEDRNISDEDTLAQIASACGLDGKMLVKSSATAGVQEQYERNTDEAMAANVFGVPWYVVDGEGFWGQDRLDFVERALS